MCVCDPPPLLTTAVVSGNFSLIVGRVILIIFTVYRDGRVSLWKDER